MGEGGLFEGGGLFISWENYMIIFLQHKEMCVKRLCILTILTTLNVLRCSTIQIYDMF